MKILVESGKLTPDSLATLLLRKTDWHDYDGIKWLLERGVDPGPSHALGEDGAAQRHPERQRSPIVKLLLNHGANPVGRRHTSGARLAAAPDIERRSRWRRGAVAAMC